MKSSSSKAYMYCPVVQGDLEVQESPDFQEDLQDHKNPDLGFPSVLWVHGYQGTQCCLDDLNRKPRLAVIIILTQILDTRMLWMVARALQCHC